MSTRSNHGEFYLTVLRALPALIAAVAPLIDSVVMDLVNGSVFVTSVTYGVKIREAPTQASLTMIFAHMQPSSIGGLRTSKVENLQEFQGLVSPHSLALNWFLTKWALKKASSLSVLL